MKTYKMALIVLNHALFAALILNYCHDDNLQNRSMGVSNLKDPPKN